MRVAVACVILAAGCLRNPAYVCQDNSDCVSSAGAGTCETATGYCSFDDPGCGPPGRRYGDLSGPLSGQCVGGGTGGDGGVTIDAPDGPASDVDGDGVMNDTDNCRDVANADQGNEDGDALGDACDPCPIAADNTDTDADGVGDACDPNPTTPGDAFVGFAGFAGTALPAGWQTSGTWTVANGEASVNSGNNNFARFSMVSNSTKQKVTASATVVNTNGPINSVGTMDDNNPGNNSAIHCNVFHNQIAARKVGVSVLDVGNINGAQTADYDMTDNQTYLFEETRDGTAYTCRASRGGTTANVAGTYNVANNPHAAGAMVFSASARYQWVMIVRSP